MKKIAALCVVMGAVAIAIVAFERVRRTHSQDDLHGVEVVRVTRRDVGSMVKATGVIKPMVGAEVRVGSSASGVVRRLYVRIGDAAEKGQLLAELDDRDLIARRDAAAAAVELSQANLDYARADLRRKRDLGAAQVIAASDLDLAQQAYSVAEQQYNQAQANLKDANVQLSYARIFAPIAGVVESVTTHEGETVASSFSAPTFVTLLDLARLEVWAYVDETDIGRIKIGQKTSFTVDTYGDHSFEGRITAVHPQAEIRDNVVDYVVVVRFESARVYILRPEMTTTVRIALERHPSALVLPLRAVRRGGDRQFVICRQGERTERRWVTTGIRDDSYWEIVNGLREGDEVLVGDPKTE
jgi:macrolide-specific efflux system membrane fusion protein